MREKLIELTPCWLNHIEQTHYQGLTRLHKYIGSWYSLHEDKETSFSRDPHLIEPVGNFKLIVKHWAKYFNNKSWFQLEYKKKLISDERDIRYINSSRYAQV